MNANEYLKKTIETVENIRFNDCSFNLSEFKAIKTLIKIAKLKLEKDIKGE